MGNRPVQFPYVTPAPHESVKTLRSLVNIRKDSLRLVRYKDGADSPTEDGEKPRVLYSLEFTFDADARVAITVYCQAVEEFLNGTAAYSPKSPALQSETVHYKRGVSQQFSLPSFKIDFSEWKDDELNFDLDRGVFPVVIQAVVDEGDGEWHLPSTPFPGTRTFSPHPSGAAGFGPETVPMWLSRLRVPGAPLPAGGADPAPPGWSRGQTGQWRWHPPCGGPTKAVSTRTVPTATSRCRGPRGPRWGGLHMQAASWGSAVLREEAQGWGWGGGGRL